VPELDPQQADDFTRIGCYFSRVLVWLSEERSLVAIGQRMIALLTVARPALAVGLPAAKPEHVRELYHEILAGIDPLVVGKYYRADLAWCRRTRSISQLGTRTFAMIYVVARHLLNDLSTNAAIASLQNKTRQAFNRLVQNYRDSRRGFRNAVMRDEGTRRKCQSAQTRN
jgi:hypothetical protein